MAKNNAPSHEILEAALQGLELQRQKLEGQIAEVRSLLGRRVGRPPKGPAAGATGTAEVSGEGTSAASGGRRKKRTLSAEARKRIAAAQKKRWAAFRKNQA